MAQSCSLDARQCNQSSKVSLSYPDYPILHLKAVQVKTQKPGTYIMKICFVFKFFIITIMEAMRMTVEKLTGETELASDTNDMKFLLSVVAF